MLNLRRKVTRSEMIWTLVFTAIVIVWFDYIIFFAYKSYRCVDENINTLLTIGEPNQHQYKLHDMACNKTSASYPEDISIICQGEKPRIAVLMYTRGRFFIRDTYILFAFDDGTQKTFLKSESYFHVDETRHHEKTLADWILETSDEDAELKCNGKVIARTYSPVIKTEEYREDKYFKYCYFKSNINHIMVQYGYTEYDSDTIE